MMVGGSRQETLDPGFVLLGTRQQGEPVFLRQLMFPDGLHPVSTRFTVRDVTTELSEPQPASWVVINVIRVLSFLVQNFVHIKTRW
ncbi:unnamed protein product [Schistosoma mattheei]|uniref:Uncharacterized protein n=1 Tax=Schistosoma mattheei TaxID=31246 RepID=A0A183Q142_9TREM|nr:unnamed protein product [Schistosoma mattheei]